MERREQLRKLLRLLSPLGLRPPNEEEFLDKVIKARSTPECAQHPCTDVWCPAICTCHNESPEEAE